MPYAEREKLLAYQRLWHKTRRSEIRQSREQRFEALMTKIAACGGQPVRIQNVLRDLTELVREMALRSPTE